MGGELGPGGGGEGTQRAGEYLLDYEVPMGLAVFLQLRLADSDIVTRLRTALEHLVGPMVDSNVGLQVGFDSHSVVAEVAFERLFT